VLTYTGLAPPKQCVRHQLTAVPFRFFMEEIDLNCADVHGSSPAPLENDGAPNLHPGLNWFKPGFKSFKFTLHVGLCPVTFVINSGFGHVPRGISVRYVTRSALGEMGCWEEIDLNCADVHGSSPANPQTVPSRRMCIGVCSSPVT
jgi:hypothetical protein